MADKFQLKALITGVDKLSPVLSGVRKNAAQFRKQLNSSGLGNIGFSDVLQGGALATPFVMGAQAAMKFESAMADVKKVVNFDTPAQFAQMNDDVLDLSERLPMAADGIAQIVAAGGQSGIARAELNQFAEDAVKMGVAFDQTADQAGGQMAKWRTAFRLTQQGVVQLADQINYLGNTGPANARQISGIVSAIGPLGEVAGVTSAQIAAMGATLAGIGIADDVAATGLKNFMLALTKGKSATKAQSQVFKALRLDAAELAKGMQTDAAGTIDRVLTALSKVDKDKQSAALSQLFGQESIGAIAPMLTNLEQLRGNFAKVADSTKYAGSMQAEYDARAATTENNLQLLQNRVTRLGISVGAALLPPFNDFMATIGPLITDVSKLAAANPWLIKGILGAAVGFGVLRLSVMAASVAMGIMNAVTSMSPIGLIVRGIALAAGFLIANWSTVGPWVEALWKRIEGPAKVFWEWIKFAWSWSPLGLIVNNWEPIVGWLAELWDRVKGPAATLWDWMKLAFSFSPLGMIIENWEPIVAWMAALWERVRPYVEPIFAAAKWAVGADGEESASGLQGSAGSRPLPMGGVGSTSLAAQSQALQGANLQGSLVVRLENAPPGTRVEKPQTNQPGLLVTPQVGYRSLSGG